MIVYKESRRDLSGAKTWIVVDEATNTEIGKISFRGPDYGWGFVGNSDAYILKHEMEHITSFLKARDKEPSDPLHDFEAHLRDLINRYSKENGSDTPDYILAEYMLSCLRAFNVAVNKRDSEYALPVDPTVRAT